LSCPDSLWTSSEHENQFWHVAYHVLFYTHFYLHPSEKEYIPWDKHKDEYVSLGDPRKWVEKVEPFGRGEVLAYLELCLYQMESLVDALHLEAESGFYWLPFTKLELQIYNLRHLQQHTGELCERLTTSGAAEVEWVGMLPV
ncbi:MAG: DinB family protein, partial [Anaerolineae bacterium]